MSYGWLSAIDWEGTQPLYEPGGASAPFVDPARVPRRRPSWCLKFRSAFVFRDSARRSGSRDRRSSGPRGTRSRRSGAELASARRPRHSHTPSPR